MTMNAVTEDEKLGGGANLAGFSAKTQRIAREMIDDDQDPSYAQLREIERRNSKKTSSTKPSKNAKKSRETAKDFGGKALTGSQKQKNWAEHIRREFIDEFKNTEPELVETIVSSPHCMSAKFWIEKMRGSACKQILDDAREHVREQNSATAQIVVRPRNKSEIMSEAWRLARAGAADHGGSAKQYFAEALREAWAEYKCIFD